MPSSRSSTRGLDDAVGVEHQRLPRTQAALAGREVRLRDHAERHPAGVVDRPAALPEVPVQRGRVAGAGDGVVAGDEVDLDVHRGREGLLGLLAQQEAVGGGHQLGRRQGADEAAEGAGELERLWSDRGALAAHVDERHLEPPALAQVGDEEVAGIAGPVGGDGGRLRAPPLGQRRDHALVLQPVAQLAEHRLAERHRQSGALPARLVERQQDRDREDQQRRRPARGREAGLVRRPQGHACKHGDEEEQGHEPQEHRADHEEEEPHRDRHHDPGEHPDADRCRDEGEEHEQQERLAPARPGAPALDALADVGLAPADHRSQRTRHVRRLGLGQPSARWNGDISRGPR